jgi:hypothetical protein
VQATCDQSQVACVSETVARYRVSKYSHRHSVKFFETNIIIWKIEYSGATRLGAKTKSFFFLLLFILSVMQLECSSFLSSTVTEKKIYLRRLYIVRFAASNYSVFHKCIISSRKISGLHLLSLFKQHSHKK